MIQRILSSKNFVACLLAAATGMALYFKVPFPADNVFLQVMAHLDCEAPHGEGQRNSPGELSPSERDWAFAKRALVRGDDPEKVICRITDYRGDEKYTNYVRYTVEKAQMELQCRAASLQPTERSLTQTNEPSHEQ